jgi:hypothetical protein
MTASLDFEQTWLAKLRQSVRSFAGSDVAEAVLAGSEDLSTKSSKEEIIAWTQMTMVRLESLEGDDKLCREIMTGCACQYPKTELAPVVEAYRDSGSIDAAIGMLQQMFEDFLRTALSVDEETIEEIRRLGWGLAGRRVGDKILATKIPKSGFLLRYLREQDADLRRQLYCHCPRVRDMLKTGGSLPDIYCYCGAGFYKGIWETILQRPVDVTLLSSVLAGDDVCTVAVRLMDEEVPA